MTLLPLSLSPADRRLTGAQATGVASRLEALGWRAEGINVGQGLSLVEVRAARVRGTPLVAMLRTPGDVEAFGRAWPGRWPAGPRLSVEDWQWCREAARGGAEAPPAGPLLRPPSRAAGPDGGAAGRELRRRREALGLGQRAAASRLRVSRSYLAEIERGRRDGPEAQAVAAAGLAVLDPEGGAAA
jgi:hypothetical protein